MKFIQTLTGDFINIDFVKKIYHESLNINGKVRLYSYLEDSNGKCHDFLDCPDSITDSFGNTCSFETEDIMHLHFCAITVINEHDQTLPNSELDEKTWKLFCERKA